MITLDVEKQLELVKHDKKTNEEILKEMNEKCQILLDKLIEKQKRKINNG
jgi:hypothetical protein